MEGGPFGALTNLESFFVYIETLPFDVGQKELLRELIRNTEKNGTFTVFRAEKVVEVKLTKEDTPETRGDKITKAFDDFYEEEKPGPILPDPEFKKDPLEGVTFYFKESDIGAYIGYIDSQNMGFGDKDLLKRLVEGKRAGTLTISLNGDFSKEIEISYNMNVDERMDAVTKILMEFDEPILEALRNPEEMLQVAFNEIHIH